MNEEQIKGWTKALAYCIQLTEKEFGTGEFILSESGLKLKDCKEAGVDEYDMFVVKKLMREQKEAEERRKLREARKLNDVKEKEGEHGN